MAVAVVAIATAVAAGIAGKDGPQFLRLWQFEQSGLASLIWPALLLSAFALRLAAHPEIRVLYPQRFGVEGVLRNTGILLRLVIPQ